MYGTRESSANNGQYSPHLPHLNPNLRRPSADERTLHDNSTFDSPHSYSPLPLHSQLQNVSRRGSGASIETTTQAAPNSPHLISRSLQGFTNNGLPHLSRQNTDTNLTDAATSFDQKVAPVHTQQVPSKIIFKTTDRRGKLANNKKDTVPARLVYFTNLGGRMNWFLSTTGETTIGRKEDNDVVLSDTKISKHHAVIKKTEKGFAVKDRNSSNGVKINEKQIEPNKFIPLQDSDQILIGMIVLIFYDEMSKEKRRTLPPVNNRYSIFNPVPPPPDEEEDRFLDLVTILPSEQKYEETVTIREEIAAEEEVDFRKLDLVDPINETTLREDYEKLRLAYELSKVSLTNDINSLLGKSLDLMFEILPVDRGVVLLVDQTTGLLVTHYVKLREGKANETREILLSLTILRKVYYSRKCLITSDAYEDPTLGKAASVRTGQIRSVICVPLIAHSKVLGILHIDSRDRINSFSSKDLSLVKAVSNQTAMAIENNILVKEVESKARITEQLSRFLAPHVVDRMVNSGEIIRKGGQVLEGTIIFADIRGFTNLSERSGPSETVNLLNDYFERLVQIVFKYDGVVDKYIGDALMCVFGTLEEEKESEFRAVAAALEFQEAIYEMNKIRSRQGKEKIYVGVGVNTGELLAGFIGCSQRLEYTCIGDTVNTSSRICSMAQEDQVLISEFTWEKVRYKVDCQQIGLRTFKGKTKEVMVYEAVRLKEGVQYVPKV